MICLDKTHDWRIFPFLRVGVGFDGRGKDAGESLTAVPNVAPVVLEARPDAQAAPTVRIFLGTRPEQYRAERVFFYSLLQVRNPDRRYEVYRLTGLANGRFAVPELAGRHGRAIYNEVGQIYLADPAELFDQPMGEHGYLALHPEETTVMLIDCARMAPCWNLASARRGAGKALQAQANAEPGRWGELDPLWHARDLEYLPERSKLLHYRSRNLQPWRPSPERCSYHINPHAEYFHSLEQAADRAGYDIYTVRHPSPGFALACRSEALLIEAWSDGGERLVARWSPEQLRRDYLPVRDSIAVSGLERLPAEDIPWLLDRLFRLGRQQVLVRAALGPRGSMIDSQAGWLALLRRVALRYPERSWQLDCPDREGRMQSYRADFFRRTKNEAEPPKVWVLRGIHSGDNAQLLDLVEALGWPYEIKPLRACLTEPTSAWPDLLISVGWLSSLVARRIRHRSAGHTRLVVLGRPFAPLSHFDLVVTTPQYGLPLRQNVVDLPAPFTNERQLDPAKLEAWRQRFAHLPRPWIALLVGGSSKPYRLDERTAAALGREVSAAASARGGSLLVSTSPRTADKAADALLEAIDAPCWSYRYADTGDNPYPALLALADAFIVTGESVSMMTEACMTGRRVATLPLPASRRPLGWLLNALEHWAGVIGPEPTGGAARLRQRTLGRLYDRLVEAGWINRERRFDQVHLALGIAPLPTGLDQLPGITPELLAASRERAVRAIRELMAAERPARQKETLPGRQPVEGVGQPHPAWEHV